MKRLALFALIITILLISAMAQAAPITFNLRYQWDNSALPQVPVPLDPALVTYEISSSIDNGVTWVLQKSGIPYTLSGGKSAGAFDFVVSDNETRVIIVRVRAIAQSVNAYSVWSPSSDPITLANIAIGAAGKPVNVAITQK